MQATRPIVIIDEPQSVDSTEGAQEAIKRLNPLCTLRYSATHRNAYSLVYRLSPYDAYRQNLVKQIEVGAAIEEENANLPYIRLENIDIVSKKPAAQVTVDVQAKSGKVTRKAIRLKHGDKLWEKTNRTDYDGFEVSEVNFQTGYDAQFTNPLGRTYYIRAKYKFW